MKSLVQLSCLVLLGAATAYAQWPHINQKVAGKQVVIRKVLLLPAHVSFDKVGTRGSEGGIPQADQIASSFYSAVAQELSLRGVEVLPNAFDQAQDDASRYSVADIQSRYDNVAVQVRRKPGRVDKGQATLSDRVAKLEPTGSADALVVMRGSGHTFTPARKALAAATWNPIGLAAEFHGEIALVDAKTGEVLVFVRFMRNRNMTEKTDERLNQSVRAALHDVPFPMPPPKK